MVTIISLVGFNIRRVGPGKLNSNFGVGCPTRRNSESLPSSVPEVQLSRERGLIRVLTQPWQMPGGLGSSAGNGRGFFFGGGGRM